MADVLAITTSRVNREQIVADKYHILHQELMHIRTEFVHLNSCSMYVASADITLTSRKLGVSSNTL